MELDPVLLSRLQFAWVVAFHILLPAFTVGLASFIATLEGLHFVTGRAIYLHISQFWIKIFSVPVRHQLEPLLRRDGQCAWPALRL
jgi:cytochrome d ubiquinol oxidase subunit I